MKNEVIRYIVVFFLLILVFFTYSVLVSTLPTQNIKKNITKSIYDMYDEGCYPYGIINKKECQMDNFTDALILSQNFSIDNKKPVRSSMNTKFAIRPSQNPITEAKNQVDLCENVGFEHYPRYWHGNTFLIRPFLMVFDYSEIRWIMYAISSLLSLILGIKLFQTLGMKKTIAFFGGLLCVNIFITQFSIQFFAAVILSIIACILVCEHFYNRKKVLFLSFIFGCLTSYFDLLTLPLLTCGLPLIIYISAENESRFIEKLTTLVLFSGLWGVGYLLTWVSKWAFGTIFADFNVFKDALDTVVYRTSSEGFSRFEAIISNFHLLQTSFIYLILILLLPFVLFFFNNKSLKTNLLLLMVALFPYLWFLVAAQHSWWHWWFTFRIQAISVIAVFFIFINFISWDKVFKNVINKKIASSKKS